MKLTPRIATMSGTSGARRARSPLALVGALCASVALLLGIGAPTASAATPIDSYGYLSTFGDGTGLVFAPQYNAVAVDGETGNILVAETVDGSGEYGVVRVYSPDPAAGGAPLTSVVTSGLPFDVAVDQADGSMYVVTDAGLRRYVSDGAPVPTYTLDASFASPLVGERIGIAVDPVTHDILISNNGSGRVYRYDPTGALVSSFDGSGTSAGAFQRLGSLAVGPTGTVYAVDLMNAGPGRVERFSPAGVSLGSLPIATGKPSSIAVNPQSGEVAAVVARQGQTFIEGFTAAGQPTFTERFPQLASGEPFGLAWDAGTDRLYLDVNFGSSGTIHTFVPATQPGLDAPVISQITGTGAHVSAKVAPGGEAGEETKARIEYCPATAKCGEYPVSDPNPESGNPWVRLTDHENLQAEPDEPSGSGEKQIADDLSGLAPNTDYLVRTSTDRTSADGVPTESTSAATALHTLLVPPLVQTGLAGAVSDSQATLTGTITTYGDQTTFRFEYGLDTNYGSSAPAGAEGIAGNSRTPRSFSRTIEYLQPGTTYHYRLVAQNSAGTSEGADRTFTTQSSDQVPPRRAYEQVTPIDKRGATVNTYGFRAADDGSAISYMVAGAATDTLGAPLTPTYVSRRGSSGWGEWQPIDPPQNIINGGITELFTQAISPDFTHALVVSNRALTPGGIEGGGNLYLSDLQKGGYELVGAASGEGAYSNMVFPGTGNMYIAGAPDFSWVVFASISPLLPGVNGAALYKWTSTGGLELESRLPDGSIPTSSITMQSSSVKTTREVSDDGDIVYFTLRDAPQAGVYRRTAGQTTAISVSRIPGDPTTPVHGSLYGTSRDGRYAFFGSGQLTSDAAPESVGGTDLYRYDSVTEDLTYIANMITGEPENVPGISDDGQTVYYNANNPGGGAHVWRDSVTHAITAETLRDNTFASPTGRFLAYRGADGDAHLYDAESDQSVCLSCRVDGSSSGDAVFINGIPEDPAFIGSKRYNGNRVPQPVTNSGMVFFSTAAALLSADHNDSADVYGYQGGSLELISPGDANFDASFADASTDGTSVFFVTDEALVSQDTDRGKDIYVARIGGGFTSQSPAPATPPCAGDACQGVIPSPPVSPVVGSTAANGLGIRGPSKAPRKCKKRHKGGKCHKARKHPNRTATSNRGGAK